MGSALKLENGISNTTKMLFSLVAVALAASTVGCSGKTGSFDMLSESASFNQSSAEVNGKIDVLWVIDNSGSMLTSQQAVAANFQRFIEKFQANGFDFRIAVTTTEAYRDDFNASLGLSVYRQGNYTDDNNVTVQAPKILAPDTPNLEKAFIANIMRGITGSGDERAWSSMKAALANQSNAALGFPRADAFLSVIVVSDEDDFSWNGTGLLEYQYGDPRLYTAQSYVDFMDTLTNSSAGSRHYNINSIAIFDEQCRTSLGGGTRKIGIRYEQLSDLSNGLKGSLCDDFGTTLSSISNKIIELSTQFYLDRTPSAGSLRVYVNSTEVPDSATNGYTYNIQNNSITFHGSGVPEAGAQIVVSYTPTELR